MSVCVCVQFVLPWKMKGVFFRTVVLSIHFSQLLREKLRENASDGSANVIVDPDSLRLAQHIPLLLFTQIKESPSFVQRSCINRTYFQIYCTHTFICGAHYWFGSDESHGALCPAAGGIAYLPEAFPVALFIQIIWLLRSPKRDAIHLNFFCSPSHSHSQAFTNDCLL